MERLTRESILIEMELHLDGVEESIRCFGRAKRTAHQNTGTPSIGIALTAFATQSDEINLRLWLVHQLAHQCRVKHGWPLEPTDRGVEIVNYPNDLKVLRTL
jgi:hypothetical protein